MSKLKRRSRCSEEGCQKKGLACFDLGKMPGDAPDDFLCHDHITEGGYCYICGCFACGLESFSFGKYKGTCQSCADQLEVEFADEQELDHEYDPYMEEHWDEHWKESSEKV